MYESLTQKWLWVKNLHEGAKSAKQIAIVFQEACDSFC